MRISDWSSDVCSSDLLHDVALGIFLDNAHRLVVDDVIEGRARLAGDLEELAFVIAQLGFIDREPGDLFSNARLGDRPHHCGDQLVDLLLRSEEHTSELQSLMRISYAVFCLKKKNTSSYT